MSELCQTRNVEVSTQIAKEHSCSHGFPRHGLEEKQILMQIKGRHIGDCCNLTLLEFGLSIARMSRRANSLIHVESSFWNIPIGSMSSYLNWQRKVFFCQNVIVIHNALFWSALSQLTWLTFRRKVFRRRLFRRSEQARGRQSRRQGKQRARLRPEHEVYFPSEKVASLNPACFPSRETTALTGRRWALFCNLCWELYRLTMNLPSGMMIVTLTTLLPS